MGQVCVIILSGLDYFAPLCPLTLDECNSDDALISLAPIIPVLVASHMLLNLRDVMRISSTVVGSSGTMAPMNGGSHSQTIVSPWSIPNSKVSKSGAGTGMGSMARDSLHNYDANKHRIEGPLDIGLRPGTRGMEWNNSTSARTMTTAVEEERSIPVFSKAAPGLHGEPPVGAAGHRASDEEEGGIMRTTAPHSEGGNRVYLPHDPYAYGASDDDDEGEGGLFDEYPRRLRDVHISLPIPTRQAVEELELGERIPTRTRVRPGPAAERSATGLIIPRSQSDALGGTDAGEERLEGRGPPLRTARRTAGQPTHNDQGSDGGSVLIIE